MITAVRPRRDTTREQALETEPEEAVGRRATLLGVVIAVGIAWPRLFGGSERLSFGRLRPLHTNPAIVSFALRPSGHR